MFVVEDGTGLEDANSYASVAAYRAYHILRGRNVSDGTYEVESATIAAGGTGYNIGDLLTASGGEFSDAAVFVVDAVVGGAVTEVSVMSPGKYTTTPDNPVATTTDGAGSGCELTLTFTQPGQTDAQIQPLLVRATDYIEKRFGSRYLGSRATDTQSLGFPRSGIYVDGVLLDDESVPTRLAQATIEYARRAELYDELAPDKPVPFDRLDADGETVSGGGLVTSRRERIGPISEGTDYADPSTVFTSLIPAYPAADMLISPLVRSSGRTIRA